MGKNIKVLATVLAAALLLLTVGCTSEKSDAKDISSGKSLTKPVNIIVIVDTSDRVSKVRNPLQVEKDIKITKNIVNIFEEKFVRPNLYIGSKDRLALAIPEQPNISPIQQQTLENLKIWPTPKQRTSGAPEFKKMKTNLLGAIDQLYQSVGKQTEFTGSDIWKWFRDSAGVYLKPDTRNYIICLSDGYLDFNNDIQNGRSKIGNKTSYIPYSQVKKFRDMPNWKQEFHTKGHGLLEIKQDFSNDNVKFLMVEITHRHMLDLEIVKEYWQTWLKSMGITDSQFLPTQDDPEIVIEKIKEFISTE
jgi:hypothetical protein